jgi:hypothetical protein
MRAAKRLAVLDLVGNQLTPAAAELIMQALQLNPTISGLALHGNPKLGRPVQRKLEQMIAARRPEEYNKASAMLPTLRRPASLPLE